MPNFPVFRIPEVNIFHIPESRFPLGRYIHCIDLLLQVRSSNNLSVFLVNQSYPLPVLQLAISADNGVDAHRPILCMPIRNNKFEIIGK